MTAADDDFRRWFDGVLRALRPADERLLFGQRAVRELAPKMLVFGRQGQCAVMPIPYANEEDRAQAAYLHRQIGGQADLVYGVVMINEAWMLKSIPLASAFPESIAGHPMRSEAVAYNAIRGTMQLVAMCEIDRARRTLAEPIVFDASDKRGP